MAEFVLKYADARGQIKQEIAEAGSEQELRERFTQQGFLVYSVKARGKFDQLAPSLTGANRKKKLNLEKFLIFNQQFVTLIKAGLPILKSLDLLATRLTDARMSPLISAVRDDVRVGTSLSDAFAKQGVFPPIYVTSLLAGERSGAGGRRSGRRRRNAAEPTTPSATISCQFICCPEASSCAVSGKTISPIGVRERRARQPVRRQHPQHQGNPQGSIRVPA